MEPISREERRKIFRQELFTLREKGYLTKSIVEIVAKAHNQFQLDLIEEEAIQLPTEMKISINKKPVPPQPQKVKKVLSSEEIRERNITWSLNIGVIFLLIGGLFVATSNWESMTSVMKSGSIAIVSLLFYGIALLAFKVLKIDKTAFAFTVLGSLFLPIFILSLGWFGLLGTYLSINGEGKYVLGMLGSFLPLIVYTTFASKLKSRLFVWFSYVTVTSGAAFLAASLKLSVDFFYLGMMLFNAIIIILYHKFKGKEAYKLFTKEFVPYVQVNLVLCTLFMLFLYDNEVLYSFNLLLTAIIYLSMMFVSGRKEYHFIFSIMIVYGAYQLIEHSFLDHFGSVVYAMVGFGIVFVPKALGGKFALDKTFQYTSAIISGFAFIYISLEGILLRAGNPSIVLMLAYLVIAGNFLYLSHNSKIPLFPYLSAVFTASSLYEAIAMFAKPFQMNISFSIFIAGFILFLVFGIVLSNKFIKIIQNSSKDVGLGLMALAIMAALVFFKWWELGVMLLLVTVISFLLIKKEKRRHYKDAAFWILPASLGLAAPAFGEEINSISSIYFAEYGYAVNFAAGAFLVLLSSFAWRRVAEKELERFSLYISQGIYTIGIACAIFCPINVLWVQSFVLLIGIGMYYYLYKKVGTKWVPFLICSATFLTYFSIVNAVSQKIHFNQSANSLIATTSVVLLLIIAFISRKLDKDLSNAYAWSGHVIYPFALAFTWFAYNFESIYSFITALFVYGLSTRYAVKEWKIKAFLYGSFTALFVTVSLALGKTLVRYFGNYEFPITSCLILIFSLAVNKEMQRRTAYYFVPFSIMGIGFMIMNYPFTWVSYVITCLYAFAAVFYLHKIKWNLIEIIPLFLAFLATAEISYVSDMDGLEKMLLSGGMGIAMSILGQFNYKMLLESGKKPKENKVDGFTIISLLFFGFMYFFETQALWTHAIPGILIAVTIWMQRKRVPGNLSVFMSILGGAYLLEPYYSLIQELNIPAFWEREAEVLPFILLVIFIRFLLKGRYSEITKAIQWGVLIIVALLLIQDGLASNTIYDAIILGSLSLLSMISGMFLQIKSYFFTGAGVLLLNVFLQTRPYWGNMPWWFYLLIAGLVLISIASFNEWHKQKVLKGEKTFISSLKERIIDRIKQWD
ncbi:hypothetical protein ACIFOT_32110 [Neobacillus sp. NRS-1170]|uniref:hypothetical protein n=1 Tax=Neobacillus sp. NRS-1170 TaxID=3233898 RepID=UPI003D29A3B2